MKRRIILVLLAIVLVIKLAWPTSIVAADSDDGQADTGTNDTQTTADTEKDGWVKVGKKTYYYKSGHLVKGLVKIGNFNYLFDKKGQMLTGVRKTPHQENYSYYRANGRRSEKSISTKKAHYWIKQGKITGIKNQAKVISQKPELPTGCEMTAVTMMLNFAGVKVSKLTVAKKTPRSNNPNRGFIGSPYKEYPAGYWVAPDGIKGVVKHYLGKASVMSGKSLKSIKKKLLRSHLVVVWVKGIDGLANHALTLTGYHKSKLYYNDPWTGKKSSISEKKFMPHWRGDGLRALSY
ncbi:C39 family peptidase [Lactobacillus sp. ESL0684]|uniref:C39 family peptidase n=1 Tax=unclassified Lactobacillus TaxID=2620435 RepID=UPI0023FA2813|nr:MULTISPECIES: C39 family peptidase [unclassified Lactobacillus]WEV41031.1 C39 family peptidase [Lactobacillus sp. ESL0681]WEV44138.1 C39 family peptidase [Lactobacillus sp. ESL0684]